MIYVTHDTGPAAGGLGLRAAVTLLTGFTEPQPVALLLTLHWVALLLGPLFLAGSPGPGPVIGRLGVALFVAYTVGLRIAARRVTAASSQVAASRAVVGVDLLLVTGVVIASGEPMGDAYLLYHFLLAAAAVVLSPAESLIAAGAAACLYVLAGAVLAHGDPVLDEATRAFLPVRIGARAACLMLAGVATTALAARERRHRQAWADDRRRFMDLREAHAKLAQHARDMSRRAVTDGLTKLHNHAYFQQRLDEEFRRAQRYGTALALLLLDLDDFKSHNDTYGHVEGDRQLAGVAAAMTASIRKGDAACRYGGEEFAVIMPETDAHEAMVVAERMCRLVAGSSSGANEEGHPQSATVSIGLAGYPEHASTKTELIEAADRALYRAKAAGKNRVSCASR